ncbi:YdcF family protein [Alkalicoccobacillus gibsonii]|uniref:YdcF family protein n=1 Tax=Alkalicoccobacillus gibsonii TaxID=79881 RepID=A0ABU9VDC5_9BACI
MLKKAFLVFIFIIFISLCCHGYSIWAFTETNELVQADAAIVLGAAVWEGEPSPVFRERIHHSIWLYNNGYVDKIIFTGGRSEADLYAESEVARNYALERGVPENDGLIETKSTITEENLKEALSVLHLEGLETFTLVSDPLHMKRAMVMAQQLGMEAYSSSTPTTAYTTLATQVPFLLRELMYYMGYLVLVPFRA